MSLVLYSTDCPKCKVLEKKLNDKEITFDIVKDVDVMLEKGFMSAPMLEVDGVEMDFKRAIEWVNNK